MKQAAATATGPGEEETTVLRLVVNSRAVQVATLFGVLTGGSAFVATRKPAEPVDRIPAAILEQRRDPVDESVRFAVLKTQVEEIQKTVESIDGKVDRLVDAENRRQGEEKARRQQARH